MLQTLDADLLVVDGERRLVLACHGNVWREVGALRQTLAELEAGARRSGIRIDAEVGNAEAVFLTQLVIGGFQLRRLVKLERKSKRVQRRPPLAALAVSGGEHDEGISFFRSSARALIGDIGRSRRPLIAGGAVILIGGRDLEPEIGEPAPGRRVIRRDADDLHIDVCGALDIALSQRGVGVFPERDDRLLDGAGFILEIRLELDRGVVKGGVLEGLFGGLDGGKGGGGKYEQRGEKASAKPCRHFTPPEPALGAAGRANNVVALCDGSERVERSVGKRGQFRPAIGRSGALDQGFGEL